MNDLIKEVLVNAARLVMCHLNGAGHWHLHQRAFEPVDSPLKVKTGDTVISYDEDDMKFEYHKVVAVIDGIGYRLGRSVMWGPELLAVEKGYYAKDIKGAARLYKDQIETDIKYIDARRHVNGLKQVLREIENE